MVTSAGHKRPRVERRWIATVLSVVSFASASRGAHPDPNEVCQKSVQPIRATPPPAVKDTPWPRADIDRYILAALEQRSLRPAAAADRRAFIRRASYDLIGLPPGPEKVDAFVSDAAPDAFEKLVDHLL